MIPKIFVIIVTYKGGRWYDKCFTSLRSSDIPVHVVVIDNASNDGTVEYIREHFPEIHLIESKENLGFGRANNLGMRYALDNDCDYVFLLNQDAWIIQNDLFKKLVILSENNKEYGILSPMHLTADEKQLSIQYENINRECGRNLLSDLYCGNVKDTYETDYINAAAWFMPRRTLENVGGFNPLFYLYGEDDDYLNRVRFHMFKVAVCPKLKLIHDHKPFTFRESQFLNSNKELLVNLLDINKKEYSNKFLRYCIRKIIISYFNRQNITASHWWQCFKYVYKNRKYIRLSRTMAEKSAWI